MIFSRGRGSADRNSGPDSGQKGRHVRRGRLAARFGGSGAGAEGADDGSEAEDWLDDDADESDASHADEGLAGTSGGARDGQVVPASGPYDAAEAPRDRRPMLDFGALRVPMVAGVTITLVPGPEGELRSVILAHGASRLQLGAYAAPRTEGIWDEFRKNLREVLTREGAKPVEVTGEYGVEVRARVREGSGHTEVRHLGVDGPRWMVHGAYLGSAAQDPGRASPLQEVLRGLVVDRGVEARPISEPLPLRLPPETLAHLNDGLAADASPRTSSHRQAT